MPFIVGESYTRDHIHAELGGETVSFLPQRDGRVVCGCFSAGRNPEAPHVILVGGPDDGEGEGAVMKKARLLARQGGTIPVFLKLSSNHWLYDGPYRVKGYSEDKHLLEQKQRRAGRENVVLALFLEAASPGGAAYLLTWNPKQWPWEDVEDEARRTAEGEAVADRWSCGNTKRIRPGDRLFLLWQGVEPRGIVAAGWATSASYEGPHWDASRREKGDTALHVDVRFDRILNADVDDPLPLVVLQGGPLSAVNWSTPASGIRIREGLDELERLWREHLGLFEPDGDLSAVEGAVRMALRRHRARERWLRDAKLDEYRDAHGGRLPCQVCGFDYFEVYGEVGRDYAQVHHLKPLGDRTRPSETKLGDLAVLCASCHVMVHRGGEVRPLDGLLSPR